MLTLFYARGDVCPPTTFRQFSPEILIRGGYNFTLNLSYEITLVDKMGLVESFFKIADIAFMGGTLIPHGGQNFLEAVKYGLPIYSGASTYNFSGIVEDLQRLKILNISKFLDNSSLSSFYFVPPKKGKAIWRNSSAKKM